MRITTILSLVVASILYTGCGEEAKKAVTEATASATNAVKETANKAAEATKDTVAGASKSVSEHVEATKELVSETVNKKIEEAKVIVSEKVEVATEAAKSMLETQTSNIKVSEEEVKKAIAEREALNATSSTDTKETETKTDSTEETTTTPVTNVDAATKTAFAKCAGCHGTDGKTKALGKSAVIAGQSASELATKIAAYKAGTRNTAGMGTLMKSQVSSLDDATITALSEYISGL